MTAGPPETTLPASWYLDRAVGERERRVVFGSYAFRDPDDHATHDAVIAVSAEVTAEDAAICAVVQRNLEGGAYDTGWLSPRHETAVAAFQRWVRAAVGPASVGSDAVEPGTVA